MAAVVGDKSPSHAPKDWGERYRLEKGVWEDYTRRLEQLVCDLLAKQNIEVVQVNSRTKSVESFVSKLGRKGAKYEDPIRDVTDLVGLRVITYYLEDVDRVASCVQQGFSIVEEHSRGVITAADPDRFGYQSAQYVVRLSPQRSELAEWTQFGDRCAEIQVRTALQHAWSAIDHKLNYKSEREIPRHLKRRLSRMSALLELADEEFASLRDATEDLDQEYVREIKKGHLDLDINTASLTAYVETLGLADKWTRIAAEVGYADYKYDEDVEARDKRDLILVLQRTGIQTIKELDDLFNIAADTWGHDALQTINELSVANGFDEGGLDSAPYDTLTLVVLYGMRADAEIAAEVSYHDAIRVALAEAIAKR